MRRRKAEIAKAVEQIREHRVDRPKVSLETVRRWDRAIEDRISMKDFRARFGLRVEAAQREAARLGVELLPVRKRLVR